MSNPTQPRTMSRPNLEEALTWPSPQEASRRAFVSQISVYNWIREKKVRAYQICGRWRIDPADIERKRAERAAVLKRRKPPRPTWTEVDHGVISDQDVPL